MNYEQELTKQAEKHKSEVNNIIKNIPAEDVFHEVYRYLYPKLITPEVCSKEQSELFERQKKKEWLISEAMAWCYWLGKWDYDDAIYENGLSLIEQAILSYELLEATLSIIWDCDKNKYETAYDEYYEVRNYITNVENENYKEIFSDAFYFYCNSELTLCENVDVKFDYFNAMRDRAAETIQNAKVIYNDCAKDYNNIFSDLRCFCDEAYISDNEVFARIKGNWDLVTKAFAFIESEQRHWADITPEQEYSDGNLWNVTFQNLNEIINEYVCLEITNEILIPYYGEAVLEIFEKAKKQEYNVFSY